MAAYFEDTIAATATAPGTGAVAILRLSGRDAIAVSARILRKSSGEPPDLAPSHRARRCVLMDPESRAPIDDVLVLPMLGPGTFTGEDVVEIHTHGGRYLARAALDAALRAGARAARPGEFSERAFLNGRMDLCQAEAISDLIEARSEAGHAAAWAQLHGLLSDEILRQRDALLDARALAEAYLDFPDEELPDGSERELETAIRTCQDALRALEQTSSRGRLAREGARVTLVGRPNVGKSSLLNALLGRERAIVSAEEGTTRDYLEEPASIGGLEVLFADTAGIREAASAVESAGVERSRILAAEADLVVLLLDGSRPLVDDDRRIARDALAPGTADRGLLAVRTKSDLPRAWQDEDARDLGLQTIDLAVAAPEGRGVHTLAERIAEALRARSDGQAEDLATQPVLTRDRHLRAVQEAQDGLARALEMLHVKQPLEILSLELQAASAALEAIVGVSSSEEILDRIFSRFCIGK